MYTASKLLDEYIAAEERRESGNYNHKNQGKKKKDNNNLINLSSPSHSKHGIASILDNQYHAQRYQSNHYHYPYQNSRLHYIKTDTFHPNYSFIEYTAFSSKLDKDRISRRFQNKFYTHQLLLDNIDLSEYPIIDDNGDILSSMNQSHQITKKNHRKNLLKSWKLENDRFHQLNFTLPGITLEAIKGCSQLSTPTSTQQDKENEKDIYKLAHDCFPTQYTL